MDRGDVERARLLLPGIVPTLGQTACECLTRWAPWVPDVTRLAVRQTPMTEEQRQATLALSYTTRSREAPRDLVTRLRVMLQRVVIHEDPFRQTGLYHIQPDLPGGRHLWPDMAGKPRGRAACPVQFVKYPANLSWHHRPRGSLEAHALAVTHHDADARLIPCGPSKRARARRRCSRACASPGWPCSSACRTTSPAGPSAN